MDTPTTAQPEPTNPQPIDFISQLIVKTHRSQQVTEARVIQRTIANRCLNPKTPDTALSHLARAWCTLQECIRVMRGQPLPGQLRPDLDPVQLTKAMKRARSYGGKRLIELEHSFAEEPEPNEEAKPTKETKASKESLNSTKG